MQAHGGRLGLVEEIRRNRLAHIRAQFLPRIALCENVVGKTLGHIAAVAFLRHTKNQFHGQTITEKSKENKSFEPQRGYSITRPADGRIVKTVATVKTGDQIRTLVADGEFESEVKPPKS